MPGELFMVLIIGIPIIIILLANIAINLSRIADKNEKDD